MPFIYRYIDMNKRECVYIGKVTKDKEEGYDPLARRHEQHKREDWYKKIGEENILMQYCHVQSHADADILETYYISQYEATGQLINKAKTGWGRSRVLIFEPHIRWDNYMRGCFTQNNWLEDRFMSIVRIIKAESMDFWFRREGAVEQYVIEAVREIFTEARKAKRAEVEFECGTDGLFLRMQNELTGEADIAE